MSSLGWSLAPRYCEPKRYAIAAPPTSRQQELLLFLERYSEEHGRIPYLTEIAKAMGISSTATAHKYMVALRRRGLVGEAAMRARRSNG